MARERSDLLVKVDGTPDSIRFIDWYADPGNRTVSELWVDAQWPFQATTAPDANTAAVALDFTRIVYGFDADRVRAPRSPYLTRGAIEAALNGLEMEPRDGLIRGRPIARTRPDDAFLDAATLAPYARESRMPDVARQWAAVADWMRGLPNDRSAPLLGDETRAAPEPVAALLAAVEVQVRPARRAWHHQAVQ